MPGGKRDGSSFSLVRIKTFTFTAAVRAVLPRTGPSAPSLSIAAERSWSHLGGGLYRGRGWCRGGSGAHGDGTNVGGSWPKAFLFFFSSPCSDGMCECSSTGKGMGGAQKGLGGIGRNRAHAGDWCCPPPGL